MPLIRARAVFAQDKEFGFYQRPAIGKGKDRQTFPGNRVYSGQEFELYYDDDYPLEDKEIIENGKVVKVRKGQIADWMELLEQPKKKPGPAKGFKKVESIDD